jgi:asparagine synthase (glutamine-hydrolysing)
MLRQAFTGWLPEELLWRGKEQFGDGSGASAVLRALTRDNTPPADDSIEPTLPPLDSWPLRGNEETFYYQIWQRRFSKVRPNSTLGHFATP